MVNRINEPLLRSKMAITLEVKLPLSNFSRGIERQKQGTSTTLIFTRPVDLFSIRYFRPIFTNFQNEADCLSVDSLIGKDAK